MALEFLCPLMLYYIHQFGCLHCTAGTCGVWISVHRTKRPLPEVVSRWKQGPVCGHGCLELIHIDADGSNLTQVTDFRSNNAEWSPDGKKIVFHSDRGGHGLDI